MTSLLTIFAVIGILSMCYLFAKYHKDDNLFWVLAISLLAGMAGGAIFHKLNKQEEKKTKIEQVYNPTQVLPANSIDFYAVLGDSRAIRQTPVSKVIEIPARDIKLVSAPSKSSEEIRGQPYFMNPLNKGTPGMPFDTS